MKFPSGWRSVFERCVGKKILYPKDDDHLLRNESAKEENSGSGFSRLEDSAYFSCDEATDVAALPIANSTPGITAVMDGVSLGTVGHFNLVCDELPESTESHDQLVADLLRVSSIQDRSLRITRRRHEKVARRRRAVIIADSAEHSSESDEETTCTPTVLASVHQRPIPRANSVQIRYWEIRQKRKDLLQKRRSRGLDGCNSFDVKP